MDFKYLRRSTPVDTDGIRIINGIGQTESKAPTRLGRSSSRSEGEYSKSPESPNSKSPDSAEIYITDWAKDDDSSESDILSPKSNIPDSLSEQVKSVKLQHDKIWTDALDGKRRIISQGDLKFDLGQSVVCVLPFYLDKTSSIPNVNQTNITNNPPNIEVKDQVKSMVVVSGTIVDINYVKIGEQEDIPRETKLRSSPDTGKRNIYQQDRDWAKNLICKDWKPRDREPTGKWREDAKSEVVQTMVVSYQIKLDQPFRVTEEEIALLAAEVKSRSKLPFPYDLNFTVSSDANTVSKNANKNTTPESAIAIPVQNPNHRIVRKKKKKKGPRRNSNIRGPVPSFVLTPSKTEIIYDTITVDYRYVMGTMSKCQKIMADIKRVDKINITTFDMEQYIKRLKLYPGAFIQYSDSDGTRRTSGIANFVVIDHICLSALDVRFIIRCDTEPSRILAVSRVNSYDVRNRYNVARYKCFHPLDRYVYNIIDPNLTSFEDSIKSICEDLFTQIQVYIIQKSLCNVTDMESLVYEDATGAIHIVPKGVAVNGLNIKGSEGSYRASSSNDPQYVNSSLSILTEIETPVSKSNSFHYEPRQPSGTNKTSETVRGVKYKYTGISLTSYVKGLAYPEGNRPTQHHDYIFFHSKDYFELDVDPASSTFLDFICSSEKHRLFRNPAPNDVILAVPFMCDRDQFKGKVNLRWFYPTDEFRLLHLYITSKGRHPHFVAGINTGNANRGMRQNVVSLGDEKTFKIRGLFSGSLLCLFDLYVYGLAKQNPTLQSDFTKRFCQRYFWWERLSSELINND